MRKIIRGLILPSLMGFLLSSCAGAYYTPRIRDVTEEPVEGNYWYQRFTLYNPASTLTDCPISRTGQRINLNSPAEVSDIWRKYCRYSNEHDSRSDSN